MFSKTLLILILMPLLAESIRGALFRSGRSSSLQQRTRDTRAIRPVFDQLYDSQPPVYISPSYNAFSNDQIISRLRSLFNTQY
ncbi:unnamed protein product [Bursaphelenchus okinawaensis]|uniref:Uncharacterized protein n=1 Tax=Bursaphelenchus okinawaensis TaxID=465554 RepID=A0A811LNM5_9BILA|nr:unnamed protein product [Bursaphelenchus okinawaensis]CAG9126199.1 unnamed protein product [Bursaphelenchus okinawaensis]